MPLRAPGRAHDRVVSVGGVVLYTRHQAATVHRWHRYRWPTGSVPPQSMHGAPSRASSAGLWPASAVRSV